MNSVIIVLKNDETFKIKNVEYVEIKNNSITITYIEQQGQLSFRSFEKQEINMLIIS